MTYLEVDARAHVEVTREATEEMWDRDDTSTTWIIGDTVRRLTDNSYRAVPVSFDVVAGQKVYLIYAIYSYGDSFGHDENGGLELCGIYQTYDEAEGERVRLVGVEDYRVPWNGYFNSLTTLEVKEVEVV